LTFQVAIRINPAAFFVSVAPTMAGSPTRVTPEAMAFPSHRLLREALAPNALLTALLAPLLGALLAPAGALAQQQGYGQTLGTSPMERQMYDSNPKSGGGSSSPLGSGNPLDIMNMIRRNSSLSDATPPSSAIDDALRDFDAQAQPQPGLPPGPTSPRLPVP
jgi:hypothetical protein